MSLKQLGPGGAIVYAMWHSALPPEGYPSRLPNSAIGVLNGANSSVSKTQNWLREMSAGQVRFSSYSLVGITGRSWWSRVRLLVQWGAMGTGQVHCRYCQGSSLPLNFGRFPLWLDGGEGVSVETIFGVRWRKVIARQVIAAAMTKIFN